MYSLLTKRVKTYHDVKFHKYEITHSNTDTSNEFQYTEFDEYKKSETVEIDIPESTNQNTFTENTFTEPSIEPSIKAQNMGSPDASQDALPEPTNTDIISCCSEHN